MLARGAQAQEFERAVRGVLRGLGLSGADAVITHATVSVSDIAPGDAEATTAIQPVRDWRPDFSQLTTTAALAAAVSEGPADLDTAKAISIASSPVSIRTRGGCGSPPLPCCRSL